MADLLTVCWMLGLMTTLLCEAGALLAWLLALGFPAMQWVSLLSGVLLFAALVVGLGTIAAMPVVWRVRKNAPPKPIAVLALVAGLIPLAVILLQALRSS